MNNSLVLEESVTKTVPSEIISTETKLLNVIEAMEKVHSSNYWKIVSAWFTEELVRTQRLLRTEKDTTELFRLQGKVDALEKFSDLSVVLEKLRNDAERIKNQIKTYEKES